MGITLTDIQLQTYSAYCALLLQANSRFNLTAITEPTDVVRRHFLDSLTVVLALPASDLSRALRLVDVGSGGGLPGLPLAIAFPQWSVTLMESVNKKATFLVETAATLGLPNVEVTGGRAEDAGRSVARDWFDIACARAVASLPVLVEYCAPLVRTGGHIVLFRGRDVAGELHAARRAIDEMRCRVESTLEVPDHLPVGEGHALIILKKEGPTPEAYPRRAGVARRRPL